MKFNTILAFAFAMIASTANAEPAVIDIVPGETVTMALGEIYKKGDECREIVSTWGHDSSACWAEAVACWDGIQNSKSQVVDCPWQLMPSEESCWVAGFCGHMGMQRKAGALDQKACVNHDNAWQKGVARMGVHDTVRMDELQWRVNVSKIIFGTPLL